MTLLIIFFLVSILFSFLCSIWEAVLLSVTPSYVEIELQKDTKVGHKLKEFKEEIDKPLSAILTLNTIAHTVGAIGVGAQAGKVFGKANLMMGSIELPFNWEAVVAVLMTLAILILSEIIPKTLGANYWKSLTPFTIKSIAFISLLLTPFIWVSQLITKALKNEEGKSVLSRTDFATMTDIGEKQGVFREGESKIIRNLLSFDKIKTQDITTPRTVMAAAQATTTLKEYYNENKSIRFSRIPIYKDSIDNVEGYFLKDEFLAALLENKGDEPIASLKRDIVMVKDSLPVPDLFNKLMEEREQIALVMDQYGGVEGVVSMEDVIETLLGLEIVDEMDNQNDMQALARENWKKRAKALGLEVKNNS